MGICIQCAQVKNNKNPSFFREREIFVIKSRILYIKTDGQQVAVLDRVLFTFQT